MSITRDNSYSNGRGKEIRWAFGITATAFVVWLTSFSWLILVTAMLIWLDVITKHSFKRRRMDEDSRTCESRANFVRWQRAIRLARNVALTITYLVCAHYSWEAFVAVVVVWADEMLRSIFATRRERLAPTRIQGEVKLDPLELCIGCAIGFPAVVMLYNVKPYSYQGIAKLGILILIDAIYIWSFKQRRGRSTMERGCGVGKE